MNSSRRKIAAILEALGVPPSARRSAATPAAPACESLEGRQLLTGGLGMGGLDMSGMGLGMADVASMGSGAMPGRGVTGSSTVSAASPQLQADLTKLQADTQAIQDHSLVTPAMTSMVTADIKAIKAAETTLPNAVFVANLKAVTASVNSTPGGPTLSQAFETEVFQNAVYLSEGVSTTLINQLDADEMTVIQATGITVANEATLAADHAAITADQAKVIPIAGSTTAATPTTTTAMPAAGSTTPIVGSPSGGVGSGGLAGAIGGQGELAAVGASVLVSSPTGGVGTPMAGGVGLWGIGDQASTPTSAAGVTLAADQATLKTDLQTLQAEMQMVQATSNVTPAMEAVVRAYSSVVAGAASVAPSTTATATLKADYTTAMTNSGGPTAAQTAQVKADKDAVLASEGVNASLVSKLDAAEAAVTAASGITAAEEGALYADEAAVKADQSKVTADIAALPPVTTTTTTTTPATAANIAAPGLDFRQVGGDLGGFGPGGFGPLG